MRRFRRWQPRGPRTEQSDERQRHAIGDSARESFAALAEPNRKQIKAHCYRMMGSLHEAEDLTQETFLRAWRSFDEYEGRSSIKTWLFQIATHATIDALRQRKRLRRILPESEFAPAMDVPKGEPPTDIACSSPFPTRKSTRSQIARPVQTRVTKAVKRCGSPLWLPFSIFHPANARFCCSLMCSGGLPKRRPCLLAEP
ncbi:MAG: sigma-70 family RNA polymerase sigma factor, partial [Rhodospirillales bacterium]|nr:sigma-70 family RNA polymerase sigma factor [Rhodospirillales bacterium]